MLAMVENDNAGSLIPSGVPFLRQHVRPYRS